MKGFLFVCMMSLTGMCANAIEAELVPSDIKYLTLWGNDSSATSIPLDEHPVLTYDMENDVITCKTSSKEITFSLSIIHKYTLEADEQSSTAIRFLRKDDNGTMQVSDNGLSFGGFCPNAAISVYTVDGKLVANRRADTQGHSSISMSGWTKGVYIIKAGNITYKILKK